MRVLLITDWTANEGGIETYVTRVSHALREDGHEVRVLTSSVAPADRRQADYVALGTDNAMAQVFMQIVNPFATATVHAAIREFRPDVVQVNMFEQYLSPAIFLPLKQVPTIALVHYAKPICHTALKVLPDGAMCDMPAGLVCWRAHCVGLLEWLWDQPRYALIRSGLAQSTRILTCSRWMAKQLRLNGLTAEAIPLPVPAPRAGFRRAPSKTPAFLYCGRLNPEKGVDLLLRAFARVLSSRPTARLRILGGGPRQSALATLAQGLGIAGAVSFDGRVAFDEVETALEHAWALLVPSIWPEPLGLTAIEAIIRGVPAIASAEGGLAETVEPGVSGSLVPNGDERALAECLVQAIDRGPCPVPADVVLSLQKRHDPSHHTALLTTIFREAVDARHRRSS